MDDSLARLRERLQQQRAAGAGFDEAWAHARHEAFKGPGRVHRREWEHTLDETPDAWRSAYLRAPVTKGEQAIGLVREAA
jgi:hypothetical protein